MLLAKSSLMCKLNGNWGGNVLFDLLYNLLYSLPVLVRVFWPIFWANFSSAKCYLRRSLFDGSKGTLKWPGSLTRFLIHLTTHLQWICVRVSPLLLLNSWILPFPCHEQLHQRPQFKDNLTTIYFRSLHQVYKHLTMDGHLVSLTFTFVVDQRDTTTSRHEVSGKSHFHWQCPLVSFSVCWCSCWLVLFAKKFTQKTPFLLPLATVDVYTTTIVIECNYDYTLSQLLIAILVLLIGLLTIHSSDAIWIPKVTPWWFWKRYWAVKLLRWGRWLPPKLPLHGWINCDSTGTGLSPNWSSWIRERNCPSEYLFYLKATWPNCLLLSCPLSQLSRVLHSAPKTN